MAHQGCSNLRHGDAKEASGHTGAAVVEAGVPEPGTGDDQGRQFMRDRIRLDRDAPQKKSSEGNAPCNSISTGSDRVTRRFPSRPLTTRGSGVDRLPAEVDVLIIGCGPAGLTLAAQLAAFPGHQDPDRRAEARSVAAWPGRRDRLPYHGDVPCLWIQRAPAEGGPLGQRDDVLEARRKPRKTSSAAAGSRMSKTASPNFRMWS